MALHIRHERRHEQARRLAARKGGGPAKAVREVLENELAPQARKITLKERVKPLIDEVDALSKPELAADKAFCDTRYADDEE